VSPVIEVILMVFVRLTEGWYMRDVDRTKSGDPGNQRGIEQPDVPMLGRRRRRRRRRTGELSDTGRVD
jgi:hypothetical protein